MTAAEPKLFRLEPHFNAKGISWLEDGVIGCLEHTQTSLPGERLPNNERMICHGIPFHFPETKALDNDHISCEGQVIRTGFDRTFRQMAVLGFSAWGNYENSIRFTYVHENKVLQESKRLGLSDLCRLWEYPELAFGEQIAVEIPYYWKGTVREDYPVGIWMQTVHLNRNAILEEIELPDNPYMFIFAATFL